MIVRCLITITIRALQEVDSLYPCCFLVEPWQGWFYSQSITDSLLEVCDWPPALSTPSRRPDQATMYTNYQLDLDMPLSKLVLLYVPYRYERLTKVEPSVVAFYDTVTWNFVIANAFEHRLLNHNKPSVLTTRSSRNNTILISHHYCRLHLTIWSAMTEVMDTSTLNEAWRQALDRGSWRRSMAELAANACFYKYIKSKSHLTKYKLTIKSHTQQEVWVRFNSTHYLISRIV